MSEPSRLVERIRAEYRAMPGLKITCAQAARLWSAPEAACAAALDLLVAERFLWRAPSGCYLARPASEVTAVAASRSFRCPYCLKQNTLDRDLSIDPHQTASLRCVACHRVFSLADAA
ncbi:MAG TPA: hypothetical protein VH417_02505 [Vicinamibacterales bacterium]|jgi:hypothetical protein